MSSASAATVPRTFPDANDKPAGRPVKATVVIPGSLTWMANGAMASPCSYVLSPGTVISGAGHSTVYLKSLTTGAATPSSALMVTYQYLDSLAGIRGSSGSAVPRTAPSE